MMTFTFTTGLSSYQVQYKKTFLPIDWRAVLTWDLHRKYYLYWHVIYIDNITWIVWYAAGRFGNLGGMSKPLSRVKHDIALPQKVSCQTSTLKWGKDAKLWHTCTYTLKRTSNQPGSCSGWSPKQPPGGFTMCSSWYTTSSPGAK